jgi:hypothetical protein
MNAEHWRRPPYRRGTQTAQLYGWIFLLTFFDFFPHFLNLKSNKNSKNIEIFLIVLFRFLNKICENLIFEFFPQLFTFFVFPIFLIKKNIKLATEIQKMLDIFTHFLNKIF